MADSTAVLSDHKVVGSDGPDATTVLTTYVVLLLAIPSPMVVAPLGSAGAPSALFALGTFFYWAWFRLRGAGPAGTSTGFGGSVAVRVAALSWLFVMLVVYARAMASPIPFDEISPADNGLLKLVGLVGVLLVANDGIVSLDRHLVLLRRLVIAVGAIAALGLLQYATRELFVDRLDIPGLTQGTSGWGLVVRNGHPRPSGTSTHPIEYGVVLTMVLPLAIAFAVRSPKARWLFRLLLLMVVFAIFLSISRSALLCAGVAFVVLLVAWDMKTRICALAALVGVALVVYLTVPGVLGTITGLFTSVSEDPSIASRTGSYDLAGEFISRSPLLGRGFGTFLPKYWILDNGYLGLLIEGGILGFAGLMVLLVTVSFAAAGSRVHARNDFERDLAQGLLAAIAAGAAGLAFFDTFGFPQSAGCFFLLLGLAGSYYRLMSSRDSADGQPVEPTFGGGQPEGSP